MNFKNIVPYILIVASGGLIYFYIKSQGDKDKNTTEKKIEETTKQSSPKQNTLKQSTPKKIYFNTSKVLKLGVKGIEVRMLQLFLNLALRKANKPTLETKTGIFGKKTEDALYFVTKFKECTINDIKNAWIQSGKDWEYLKTQAAIQLTK